MLLFWILMRTRGFRSRAFILAALLSSSISAGAGGEDALDKLPWERRIELKRLLEKELQAAYGKRFFCDQSVMDCVRTYASLLEDRPQIAEGKDTVFVTSIQQGARSNGVGASGLALTPVGDSRYGAGPNDLRHSLTALQKTNQELKKIHEASNSSAPCASVNGTSEAPRNRMSGCGEDVARFYRDLFSKEVFHSTIVMGYSDQADLHSYLTGDYKVYPELNAIGFEGLKRRLVENQGFHLVSLKEPSQEAILERDFYFEGRKKVARVRIVNPNGACTGDRSSGQYFRADDGKIARIEYREEHEICREQLVRTKYAQAAFFNGLKDSQLVVYAGHARHGGGPDFGPFSRKYGKLSIEKGILNSVIPTSPLQIVYMRSCKSTDYFTDDFRKRRDLLRQKFGDQKSTLWVTHDQESFAHLDASDIARLLLGLLEQRCPKEIGDLMNAHLGWEKDASQVVIEGDPRFQALPPGYDQNHPDDRSILDKITSKAVRSVQ